MDHIKRDLIGVSIEAGFNWLFLVEVLVVVIVIIYLLFYFNRAFGAVTAFGLRLWLWRYYNVYLELGALQIAPLGGRILFKDLRYMSRNQSLRVLKGHITWRYWIWHVRDGPLAKGLATDFNAAEGGTGHGGDKNEVRPCRINVKLDGLEWFAYNRTPAYDAIIEQLAAKNDIIRDRAAFFGAPTKEPRSSQGSNEASEDSSDSSTVREGEATRKKEGSFRKAFKSYFGQIDWLLESLPLSLECTKGSIVVGNEATPSLIICDFKAADGVYVAGTTRSKFDQYQTRLDVNFQLPKIFLRTNPDYIGPLEELGRKTYQEMESQGFEAQAKSLWKEISKSQLRKLREILPFATSSGQYANRTRPTEWKGLPRYRLNDEAFFESSTLFSEYAKVTTILDAPQIQFSYYQDVAGKVPAFPRPLTVEELPGRIDIGNGGLAPEWGIDLIVRGGTVTYGPWADRQRSSLQDAFFPPVYFDSIRTPKLKPGDDRLAAALKIKVELDATTTLRIPTREASKDWRFTLNRIHGESVQTQRPYGWMDLKVGPGTVINYIMPVIADERGYGARLNMSLKTVSLASSVNYTPFLTINTITLSSFFESPLKWHQARTWDFSFDLDTPTLYLLRDHATLIADLAKDWTSGSTEERMETFVPIKYNLEIDWHNLELFVNVNDHNIIDRPTDADYNAFFVWRTPKLRSSLTVPSDTYRPVTKTIPFFITVEDSVLSTSFALSSTHRAFETARNKDFATCKDLTFDGQYTYYADSEPENVESLQLAIDADTIDFRLFGHVIRHFMNFKDNYFGIFTNFLTLEEYRGKRSDGLLGDPIDDKHAVRAADESEVNLILKFKKGKVFVPDSIYEAQSGLVIDVPLLTSTLRNCDLYMDLSVETAPATIQPIKYLSQIRSKKPQASNALILAGLAVNAHRLFGPPPRGLTYICNWDFAIESIEGQIQPDFLMTARQCAAAFSYNFVDDDNALPQELAVPVDPDVTFLKFRLHSLNVTQWIYDSALQCIMSKGVSFAMDDWSCDRWSTRMHLTIPRLEVRALSCSKDVKEMAQASDLWVEVASVRWALDLELFKGAADPETYCRKQQAFIKTCDAPTRRAAFLYHRKRHADDTKGIFIGSLFAPPMPEPLRPAQNRKFWPVKHGHSGDEEDDELSVLDDEASEQLASDELEDNSDGAGDSRRYDDTLQFDSALPEPQAVPFKNLLRCFRLRNTYHRRPGALDFEYVHGRQSPAPWKQPLQNDADRSRKRLSRLAHRRLTGSTTDSNDHARLSLFVSGACPAEILLTPLSTSLIIGWTEITQAISADPETMLDSVQIAFSKRMQEKPAAKLTTVEYQLDPGPIHISLLQEILPPGEKARFIVVPQGTEQNSTSKGVRTRRLRRRITLSADRYLSTGRISIKGMQVTGSQTSDDLTSHVYTPAQRDVQTVKILAELKIASLQFEMDYVSSVADNICGLAKIIDPQEQDPTASFPTVLSYGHNDLGMIVRASSKEAKNAAFVGVGDGNLDFMEQAAEVVIGAIYSWLTRIEEVRFVIAPSGVRKRQQSRHLVTQLSDYSDSATVIPDPAFLNRSNLAAQTSAKKNIRNVNGWKMVARLRQCLRLYPVEEKGILQKHLDSDIVTNLSPSEMYGRVIRAFQRWRSWEIDAGEVARSYLFSSLFRPSEGQVLQEDTGLQRFDWAVRSSNVVVCDLGALDVTLVDETSQNTARFAASHYRFNTEYSESETPQISKGAAKTDRSVRSVVKTKNDVYASEVNIAAEMRAGGIKADINPGFLSLVNHVFQVRAFFEVKIDRYLDDFAKLTAELAQEFPQEGERLSVARDETKIPKLNFQACATIDDMLIKALAQDLALTCELHNWQSSGAYCSTGYTSKSIEQPAVVIGNVSSTIDRLQILAEDHADGVEGDRVLLGLVWEDMHPTITFHQRVPSVATWPRYPDTISGFLDFAKLDIHVPKSAFKIYTFVTQWRTRSAVMVELLTKDIATEVSAQRTLQAQKSKSRTLPKYNIHFAFTGSQVNVTMQVLNSLRATYQVSRLLGSIVCRDGDWSSLQLGVKRQGLRFYQEDVAASTEHSDLSFKGPAMRFSAGRTAESKLNATMFVDPIDVTLDVSIVDDVLSMVSRLGSEVQELMEVLDRVSSHSSDGQEEEKASSTRNLEFDLTFMVKSMDISLASVEARQSLIAGSIVGRICKNPDKPLKWSASLGKLKLNTSQILRNKTGKERLYKVAQAVMDVDVNCDTEQDEEQSLPSLKVDVRHVRGCMQPSTIGIVGDLWDFFMVQLSQRKKEKAEEFRTLQDHTRSILRRLDLEMPSRRRKRESQNDESNSGFLDSHLVMVQILDLTLAIPIDEPYRGDSIGRDAHRPACLAHIDSVYMTAKKGQDLRARMNVLAFYFLDDFKTSSASSYEFTEPRPLNCALLPAVRFDLHTEGIRQQDRRISICPQVSGLEIDASPSLVSYVSALQDVFETSKARFYSLSEDTIISDHRDATIAGPVHEQQSAKGSLALEASFEFGYGLIRLRHLASPMDHRPSGDHAIFDTVRLPGLHVKASMISGKQASHDQLHIDAVVKTSDNVLYPTLIEFLRQVSNELESSMQRKPYQNKEAQEHATNYKQDAETGGALTKLTEAGADAKSTSGFAHMTISCSLQILQSHLELSCLPSSKVASSFHWNKGSLFLTTAPGCNGFMAHADLEGIIINLRHSYSPEDCIRAEIKEVTASGLLTGPKPAKGESRLANYIQGICSISKVSGEVNFRHLQDWLIVKAIWFDRMPVFEQLSQQESSSESADPESEERVISHTRSFALNLKELDLSLDLGQSIGRLHAVTHSLAATEVLRSDSSQEIEAKFEKIDLSMVGRLNGQGKIGAFGFRTIIGSFENIPQVRNLLNFELHAGEMDVSLEYEYQKIMVFSNTAMSVTIKDDWSKVENLNQAVRLEFFVQAGVARLLVSIRTMPIFMVLSNKLDLLIEEKKASAAVAFRGPRRQRQEKSFGRVAANVKARMKQSRGSEEGLPALKTKSSIHVTVSRLSLNVFPNLFSDGDLIHFELVDATADLDSERLPEGSLHRHLQIHLQLLALSRMSCRKLNHQEERTFTASEWASLISKGTSRNIFKTPATLLSMESWQAENSYLVEHKFLARLEGQVDVAFNFGLVKHLQGLYKLYQSQMQRAKQSSLATSALSTTTVTRVEGRSAKAEEEGKGGPNQSTRKKPSLAPINTGVERAEDVPKAPLEKRDEKAQTDKADSQNDEREIELKIANTKDHKDEVVKMPSQPLLGESHQITYRALEFVCDQPKLTLLGDATPPLEWLGVQRAKFPAFAHSGVTVMLEALSEQLLQLYSERLLRMGKNLTLPGTEGGDEAADKETPTS